MSFFWGLLNFYCLTIPCIDMMHLSHCYPYSYFAFHSCTNRNCFLKKLPPDIVFFLYVGPLSLVKSYLPEHRKEVIRWSKDKSSVAIALKERTDSQKWPLIANSTSEGVHFTSIIFISFSLRYRHSFHFCKIYLICLAEATQIKQTVNWQQSKSSFRW